MGKRYHYDAKGRLKGHSSDKYEPRLRDIVIIAVVFIIASILFPGLFQSSSSGNADAEVHASSSPKVEARTSNSKHAVSIPQASENLDYPTEQPQVDNPSGFDRDLRPYYQEECRQGDQSACSTLEKEAHRRTQNR